MGLKIFYIPPENFLLCVGGAKNAGPFRGSKNLNWQIFPAFSTSVCVLGGLKLFITPPKLLVCVCFGGV